jgi:hypothetical protein
MTTTETDLANLADHLAWDYTKRGRCVDFFGGLDRESTPAWAVEAWDNLTDGDRDSFMTSAINKIEREK